MKKVGPCCILKKIGDNAYEISLPPTLQISPIFIIVDLTPYKVVVGSNNQQGEDTSLEDEDYVTNLPQSKLVEIKAILDSKVLKKTRSRKYM